MIQMFGINTLYHYEKRLECQHVPSDRHCKHAVSPHRIKEQGRFEDQIPISKIPPFTKAIPYDLPICCVGNVVVATESRAIHDIFHLSLSRRKHL